MPGHVFRARGRIVPQVAAALTHNGWPTNRAQELELTSDCLDQLWPGMPNLPLCVNHKDHLKIGRVVKPYKDGDGAACVEFEIDESASGKLVQKLVTDRVVYGLSLKHDPNSPMKPIEVSVCEVPGRDGSYITELISPETLPAVAASEEVASALGWMKLTVASEVVDGSVASSLPVRYIRFRKDVRASDDKKAEAVPELTEEEEEKKKKEKEKDKAKTKEGDEVKKADGYVYMNNEKKPIEQEDKSKESKEQVNTSAIAPVQPSPQVPSFLGGDHVPVAYFPRAFFAPAAPPAAKSPTPPTAMDAETKEAPEKLPTRYFDTDGMQAQLDAQAEELIAEQKRQTVSAGGVQLPMGGVAKFIQNTGGFDVGGAGFPPNMQPQQRQPNQQATPLPQQRQQQQQQQPTGMQVDPPQQQDGQVKQENGQVKQENGAPAAGDAKEGGEAEDDRMKPGEAVDKLLNKKNAIMPFKDRVALARTIDAQNTELEALRKQVQSKTDEFDKYQDTVDNTIWPFLKMFAEKKRTGERLSEQESQYMESDQFQTFVNSDRGRRDIAASQCSVDDFIDVALEKKARLLQQKYNQTNASQSAFLSEADRFQGSSASGGGGGAMNTPRQQVAASAEQQQANMGFEPYVLLDGQRPMVAASQLPCAPFTPALQDYQTRPAVQASSYTGVPVHVGDDPYGDYNWPKIDERYYKAACVAARRTEEDDPDGREIFRQEMQEVYRSKVKPLSRVVAASAYASGLKGAPQVRVPPFGSDAAYGWLPPEIFWNVVDKEGKPQKSRCFPPILISKNYQSLLASTRTSAFSTTANDKLIQPRYRS